MIAVNTLSRKGCRLRMRFTLEVQGIQRIQRALTLIREVKGVTDVEARLRRLRVRARTASLCLAVDWRSAGNHRAEDCAWSVTGSVGLLSDALESFVNLAGAGFALWMILVFTRDPPDGKHPMVTARRSTSRAALKAC